VAARQASDAVRQSLMKVKKLPILADIFKFPLLTGLPGLPRMRQRHMAACAAQPLAKRSFG
jgi:hypothetical protein